MNTGKITYAFGVGSVSGVTLGGRILNGSGGRGNSSGIGIIIGDGFISGVVIVSSNSDALTHMAEI